MSTNPSDPVVTAADIVVRHGGVTVLDSAELEVGYGEVVALLGPNGAGKTTLVECLEGYQRPDSGRVDVLGRDPWRAPPAWRARIGAVPQDSRLDTELTVGEYVAMTRGYYPAPLTNTETLSMVEMGALADRRVSRLSGGERRRLEVALALVGGPDLLVLDEPTTGLDPQARRALWAVLEDLRARGTTMLLTSHSLDEVEHLADRVVILVCGRVQQSGTVGELRSASMLPDRVGFLSPEMTSPPRVSSLLDAWRDPQTGRWVLTTNDTANTVRQLQEHATEQGVDLVDVTARSPSFEDVYLDLLARLEETG